MLPVLAAAAVYGMASKDREVKIARASVDGRSYLVLQKPDASSAANLLAMVRGDLDSLVQHVSGADPDDPDFQRLRDKFNPDAISEGSPGSGYTSYTVDKGARVVLCIRQSDGQFVPKNVIMYVAVHELAHIMTNSIGHTPDFWANNARLLKAAKSMGIYHDQNFAESPQPYCGIHIGS